VLRTAIRPNQIEFSHGLDPKRANAAARENLLCEVHEFLTDDWIGERGHCRAVELRNDFLRRTLGRPQRVPERKLETRQTRLIGGRDIGCERVAVLGGDGKGLDVAGADLRHGNCRRVHHDVDLPAH